MYTNTNWQEVLNPLTTTNIPNSSHGADLKKSYITIQKVALGLFVLIGLVAMGTGAAGLLTHSVALHKIFGGAAGLLAMTCVPLAGGMGLLAIKGIKAMQEKQLGSENSESQKLPEGFVDKCPTGLPEDHAPYQQLLQNKKFTEMMLNNNSNTLVIIANDEGNFKYYSPQNTVNCVELYGCSYTLKELGWELVNFTQTSGQWSILKTDQK